MARMQQKVARVAVAAGLMLALAGCGAGAGPAAHASATAGAAASGSGAGPARFAPNPAMRAALDIIRVQPVVPFSQQQIQQMVPILQSLAGNPNLPADQLAAKGQQLEAVFTSLQTEALKNMASGQASGTGAAGNPGAGRFRRRSGTGAGTPPGTSGTSGRGPGGFRQANQGAIYQQAINVLEGKATGFSGLFPGAPGAGQGGAAAGGAAGAGGGTGNG